MDLSEAGTHSFIVRIWLEDIAPEAGEHTWRGHITHVMSGKRRYFQQMDDIAVFMKPYLEEMGVRSEQRSE